MRNAPNVRPAHARLLRGEGRYVDDIRPAGCLHAAFVRSNRANARIDRIETQRAVNHGGVALVLTACDLGHLDRPLPLLRDHPDVQYPRTQPPLAGKRVHYVGQPVAMVVAKSRYQAEDAAELVGIDYDPLPAVIDLNTAASADRLVHDDVPGNCAGEMRRRRGDPERAFREAPFLEKVKLRIERSCGSPLETRGVVASWDPHARKLEVWDSTQNPIAIHHGLARLLGLSQAEVRVAAPDVGGGFGTKIMMFYPEEVLIPLASMRLGLPVKWIEDRWEHLVSANQERGQIHDAEVAFDVAGRILAVRTDFLHDNGAFAPYGPSVPEVTMTHITGQYDIEHFEARARLIYTNTPSVTPYRGAGRPQAVFVMERLIGAVARRLDKEPQDVRRQNLIAKNRFPYDTGLELLGTQVVYDSGDYQAAFAKMDECLPLGGFRERQKAERKNGRLLGIGFGSYIEGSAPGPYEQARCSLDSTGRLTVVVSPPSQGQSHETVFGRLAAEVVGVTPDNVVFVAGDSARISSGTGTFGSRAAVYIGNAVVDAAKALRRQIVDYASELFESHPDDIAIADGRVGLKGVPESSYDLADLVAARNPIAYVEEGERVRTLRRLAALRSEASKGNRNAAFGMSEVRPPGWPNFEAQGAHSGTSLLYGSGLHGVIVEVDSSLGAVSVLDYAVVDDCGIVLDPPTVHGQIFGGVAQGIGGALLERLLFDSEGQPLSATLMGFLLPTIHDVPRIRITSIETPSPLNPLGVKGVGEAGVIAVSAAIAEAIDDAVGRAGSPIREMPITPEQVANLFARTCNGSQ
jgi:aerobic carbon-monoxide dehydrogenase large subunit